MGQNSVVGIFGELEMFILLNILAKQSGFPFVFGMHYETYYHLTFKIFLVAIALSDTVIFQ